VQMCPKFEGHNSKEPPRQTLGTARGLRWQSLLTKEIRENQHTERSQSSIEPSPYWEEDRRAETGEDRGEEGQRVREGAVHPQVPQEPEHEQVFLLDHNLTIRKGTSRSERDRERQRQRERDRERQRETETETEREGETERDRERQRQRETERDRDRERETERDRERQRQRERDRERDRERQRQRDRDKTERDRDRPGTESSLDGSFPSSRAGPRLDSRAPR
jgi:hypothetical protein